MDRKLPEMEFRSKVEPFDSITRNRGLTEHPEETEEVEEEDVVEDVVEIEEDEVSSLIRLFDFLLLISFRRCRWRTWWTWIVRW